MKKSANQLYASIQQAFINLIQNNQSLVEHMNQYLDYDKNELTPDTKISKYESRTDALIQLLERYCSTSDIPKYSTLTDNFAPLLSYVNAHKEVVILEQSKDRFYAGTDDSILLRTGKLLKRFSLKSGWLIIRFTNLFRKSKHPLKYWNHKVKEQKLAQYIYDYIFHKEFLAYYHEFLKNRHKLLRQLNAFDNKFEKKMLDTNVPQSDIKEEEEFHEYEKLLSELKTDLVSRIATIETNLNIKFDQNRRIAGTIELPSYRFSSHRNKRKSSRLLRKYQKLLRNYQIAGNAIFEYWRFEAGIRASLLAMNRTVNSSVEALNDKLKKHITPEINSLITGLKNALDLIPEKATKKSGHDELSEQITKISDTIPKTISMLDESNLISFYQAFYPSILQSLQSVPVNSWFSSKLFKVEDINKKHSLKQVNSRKILEGLLQNSIQDIFLQEQKKLQKRIQILYSDLEEILQVIEFSYEFYGPKNDQFTDKDKNEFSEGIKRAVKKVEDLQSDLHELVNSIIELLISLSQKYKSEIMVSLEPAELIMTDRKSRLRSFWRLTRRKFTDSLIFLNRSAGKSFKLLKQTYSDFKNKYLNLRSLLGISEQKEVLSSEISDYLAETEMAIAQLPLMYQRLFQIKPLVDERFYVNREQAYSQAEKAYLSWKSEKYAPTCLVGEQGSGATTLLNFLERQIKTEYEVIRIDLNKRYISQSEFTVFLKELFPDMTFSDPDELIDMLNSKNERRVIIVENIQHFFMKKTKGFENLKRLFYLISQTNKQIYWLCTCLKYSWKYLDSSQNISDYFAYVIHLENLTIENLQEAIFKRHRPSGFEMIFVPSEDTKKTRYLRRFSKVDQQLYLQTEYFDKLKEYTKGNLSFAFIYWLRSVVKMETDTLYFQFKKLKLGFLHSLDVRKITSLYAILIHSGLTIDEHAEIFGSTRKDSYIHFMVMNDDGIITKKDSKFILNPMLYRHIVNYLESANFIH